MSSMLNYKLEGQGPSLVLVHGLFGSLDNLGLLARDLAKDHQVLSLDLRNHGRSFHSDVHDYNVMADDVCQLLTSLNLSPVILVGHSMGGKVVMKMAERLGEAASHLVVLDMAPVAYPHAKHNNVFAGLQAVIDQPPANRTQAMDLLSEHIEMEGVRQFLGKSLHRQQAHLNWRFNVDAIRQNYWNILGWDEVSPVTCPTLFIKGADSDYLTAEHQPAVQRQFPAAKAHVIANTGHWLHAEKPADVLRVIRRFID